MNKNSKCILEEIKRTLQHTNSRLLIDKILAFDEDLKKLNLDYLKDGWDEGSDIRTQSEEPTPNQHTMQPRKQDLRIKMMTLQNFRTFPSHDQIPFGITFTKSGCTEPCSIFLVGKNGTGKSTIFDALEWIYTGRVRNAENRGIYSHDALKAYLTYGFGNLENITVDSVIIGTRMTGLGNKDWNLNTNNPLCVPAICCSDMDIEEISKFGEDTIVGSGQDTLADRASEFQKFIRRQLGYEDCTVLLEKLKEIGEEISYLSHKIEQRKSLSYLSANDFKKIRKFLKVLCCEIKPVEAEKYRKYSKRKLIERCASNMNVPKVMKTNNYPFKELWIELQENTRLRDEMNRAPRGIGFIREGETDEAARPTIDEIGNRINEGVNHLEAIHKRINQALDQVNKPEVDDGYNDAITSLNNDLQFVENRCDGLPYRSFELQRLQGKYHLLGNAMLELSQKLLPKLAHLFEMEASDNVYTSKFPDKLNSFVKQVLNHYSEKGEEFEVRSTANSFEVIIRVKNKDGRTYETTPQKYLNTFRFRLYALLMKIALAFYYMKENNCLAPIVIDDVFNASDFENSVSLGHFVYNVYDAYQDVLGYNEPLQLIVLTHDEMIINAFQSGLKMKSSKMMERERRGFSDHEKCCIFGRLFPYSEAEEMNVEAGKYNDCKKEKLLNLYLEIGS